jgi:hypothetical protein
MPTPSIHLGADDALPDNQRMVHIAKALPICFHGVSNQICPWQELSAQDAEYV